MIKAIVLLLGLTIGFGVGVYWGQKNPDAAARLAAEEERRFLEAQLAITQKIRARLEQLSGGGGDAETAGASGFISSRQAAAASAQDIKALRADTETQEAMLRKRLEELK